MRLGYHPEPYWWNYWIRTFTPFKRLLNNWIDKDADF